MLVTFVLEKNIDVASQEVRDRIARIIPDLPEEVDAPIIEKLDPDAAPILNIALVADKPVREITEFADKVLRRQLESVGGVGQITLLGGRLRQINVWLDPMRLRSYNLTAADVQRGLRAQNVQIPAGTWRGWKTGPRSKKPWPVTMACPLWCSPSVNKAAQTRWPWWMR